MENNTTETQQQVFCTAGVDNPLCVDNFGTVISGIPDASVPLDAQADSGTLDDALELELDSSAEAEQPILDGTTTLLMMGLGLCAFGLVALFFKKVF